jgi:acetyl esterase/lipase
MKKIAIYYCLFLLPFCLFAQDEAAIKPVLYPSGYEAKLNEVYNEGAGLQGREDVYYNPKADKPTPIAFQIHGGGWNHGTKEGINGFGSFFKAGFAVANIEYRLTTFAPAPAAIEDVRAAILYVVLHAKEWNIDPNKIVIVGGSAGGHLALMAGLLQKNHLFDTKYKDVNNFTITAIIDKYGPTDLTVPGVEKNRSAAAFIGADHLSDTKFKESISPIYWVTKNSPPIFIVHGDADPTVPYAQSVALKKKLDEIGVVNEFITIPGGGHGTFTKEQKTELGKSIIAFIEKYTK